MAAKSLEPSLMPRSAIDQGLIMAGSFATGYVVGSTSARAVGLVPVLSGTAALRMTRIVATGVHSAQFLRRFGERSIGRTDETAAWTDTGTEILTSVALAKVSSGETQPALGVASTLAVAATTLSDAQTAVRIREDHVHANYLVTATGTAIGAVSAVAALVGAIRLSGHVARRTTGTTGFSGSVVYSSAALAAAGAIAAGAKVALSRVIRSIAAGNRAVEIAYADTPSTPTVAGGSYSLIPFDSLGLQGRRLVSVVTPTSTIETVMGEPARKEPVRVFVGEESASSTEERVELAIQELRRAGGFERSAIVAVSPAGTGYVNYITVEAMELMARGDVATVAIQYGSLPSMLSMNKVAEASVLYGALVQRLRTEIDDLDRDVSLFAYGESLGAQTGQNGIESISDGSALPVDGALWVGTPYGTALFTQMTAQNGTSVFDRPSQIIGYVEAGNPIPLATFLNHDNDPVTKFTPSMFYRMPEWLKSPDRGRGVNPHQRWLPGIAFWQGIIDTKNAATVVPGEFKSTGHDYRADLATFTKIAFGFDDVTAEQMDRIEEKLRESEIERSDHIAEGKVQSA